MNAIRPFTNWSRERFFDAPMKVEQSKVNSLEFQACACGPIGDTHTDSVERNYSVLSGIPTLFATRAPLNVHRPTVCDAFFALSAGVMAIVVDSIQRIERGWSWRHVIVPVQKRALPPRANFNAAPTVMLPVANIRIQAASQHAAPYPILSRAFHPVNDTRSFNSFRPVASARSRFPTIKRGSAGDNYSATTATANPEIHPASISFCAPSSEPLDYKVEKRFSSQVLKILVGWNRTRNDAGRIGMFAHTSLANAVAYWAAAFALQSCQMSLFNARGI